VEDESNPATDSGKKKVVSFPKSKRHVPANTQVVDVAPPTVSPEIVEYLTTLLERAQRGEIQALGVAHVGADDVVRHGFHTGPGPYRHALVAAVAYLAHDLAAEACGDDHSEDDDEGAA
jgi:hypothetical protein